MNDYKQCLIKQTALKEKLARRLGLSKKIIQDAIFELVNLATKNDNVLSAAIILSTAANSNSPLHIFFNWNDIQKNSQMAEYILSELSILMDKDGNIYNIVVK